MSGTLTLEQLTDLAAAGDVDTVIIAITDMQGRLQGKRCSARYFLEEVVPHRAEGCNYLLAVDVDMRTVDGYAMSSWERGYGDFVMRPDLDTLRLVPWHPATALVLCDLEWEDGSPVEASPRQVLKRQIARLAERGLTAMVGTELEFIVFEDSYEAAWAKGYRDLAPANQYNVDYSIVGTSRIEPLLRRIRNDMTGAGLYVESAKGECNLGQHEIAFRFAEALTTCDNHSHLQDRGQGDRRPGRYESHLHVQVGRQGGQLLPHSHQPAFERRRPGHGRRPEASRRSWNTSSLDCWPAPRAHLLPGAEHQQLQAIRGRAASPLPRWPGVATTGRAPYGWSGTASRYGPNTACPAATSNPYLAVAALIAAGFHGMDNELPLEEEFIGNAYESDRPRVPASFCARRRSFCPEVRWPRPRSARAWWSTT